MEDVLFFVQLSICGLCTYFFLVLYVSKTNHSYVFTKTVCDLVYRVCTLTMVTSSIFDILLTYMLTRTTAGPSIVLVFFYYFRERFFFVWFHLVWFHSSFVYFIYVIWFVSFCVCVKTCVDKIDCANWSNLMVLTFGGKWHNCVVFCFVTKMSFIYSIVFFFRFDSFEFRIDFM